MESSEGTSDHRRGGPSNGDHSQKAQGMDEATSCQLGVYE